MTKTFDSTSRTYHNEREHARGSFSVTVFRRSSGFPKSSVYLCFSDDKFQARAFRIERDDAVKLLREIRKTS